MSNITFAVIWIVIWSIPYMYIGINAISLLFTFVPQLYGWRLLIRAIIEYVKNIETANYGKECYGIITEFRGTGATSNGKPKLRAIIKFVNPETNKTETGEYVIGYDPGEYTIGSYILCKYYKGTIVIGNICYEENIPEDIREYIVRYEVESSQVEFSSDEEYVTIDGVKYKKTYEKIND